MFGIFKKAKREPDALNTVDDLARLIRSLGAEPAGEKIKRAAREGNLNCQVFMSQAGLSIPQSSRTPHVQQETWEFTKLAAESGDAGSQFNFAKLWIDRIDASAESWSEQEWSFIRTAKSWHRRAAAQGFKPSVDSLKNLECFPD